MYVVIVLSRVNTLQCRCWPRVDITIGRPMLATLWYIIIIHLNVWLVPLSLWLWCRANRKIDKIATGNTNPALSARNPGLLFSLFSFPLDFSATYPTIEQIAPGGQYCIARLAEQYCIVRQSCNLLDCQTGSRAEGFRYNQPFTWYNVLHCKGTKCGGAICQHYESKGGARARLNRWKSTSLSSAQNTHVDPLHKMWSTVEGEAAWSQ